jgi:hypothetical protein
MWCSRSPFNLLERIATEISFNPTGSREGYTKNGVFSVKFMYEALIEHIQPVYNNKCIWKLMIPLKTKIFAWYLRRGVILIKDNLAKRNWHGCKKCVFCHEDETIKHLFFHCRFAKAIWSIIQIESNLHPPRNIANSFGNWLNGVDVSFKILSEWERSPLFGRYGYVEITRFLMTKSLRLCR